MTPAAYMQGDVVRGRIIEHTGLLATPSRPMRGPNICGIQFDNEPPHIASAIAMCPSKPSDSAIAR
jgi:hypothetical protein